MVREGFPKSARLLKSRDFRFRPYKRFQTESFTFLFTQKGQGRLGVSISKKVLRRSVARNRVRRLLKEVFRSKLVDLKECDLHVIGAPALTKSWRALRRGDVEGQFVQFMNQLGQVAVPS